jgi:2-isopropylmalate synthase
MTVELYDTTLRDGTQSEGVSFSVEDKLKITRKLDELGIHYIEGGWPGSNPKDVEYFARVRDLPLKTATVAAFSYTGRVGVAPEDDANLAALLAANTEVLTIVGKSWDLHVHEVLRTTLEKNLRIIHDTVAFLCKKGHRVFYDAEHFFDGYKANPQYALKTLGAAADGGAEVITLCDTNGGTMPWELTETMSDVQKQVGAPLGIHTHTDCELGVAKALAAVTCGAVQVQGTINGYGERVGNADLCSIIPNLKLKMGIDCITDEQLRQLTEVSYLVSELANLAHDSHQPYVGLSAFAHKGGIHADATMKCRQSYQHIEPELVGNRTRILVSELSGKSNILLKLEEFGLEHNLDREDARRVVQQIKELESQGFTFETAEASVELLVRRSREGYQPPFDLVDFMVVVEHRKGRGLLAEATVKVKVGDQVMHTAAEGNGPVNALDAALRKALLPVYPSLRDVQLTDYKVRILDGDAGTAAKTRVLIDSSNGRISWSTVGSSTNIIQASWQALVDSFEYGLLNGGEA